MQLGMIGLGRMGGNIVRRLLRGGHSCVVFDTNAASVDQLAQEGATGSQDMAHLVAQMPTPRAVWVMLPAGAITEATVTRLGELLAPGDTIIDGGNSNYQDDVRRAQAMATKGIRYIDVGTSGGVWGLDRGYCMMIGGDKPAFDHLEPIFKTLAPGMGTIEKTPGRENRQSTAEHGYLYTGPAGSGHFVKMVHNGIEYGLMQAYGEGLDILKGVNQESIPADRRYNLDLADITELWRRGSVVSSWLLDLSAISLAEDPELKSYSGYVEDSGEGRWTIQAAIEEAVPADVLTAALYTRFRSRKEHTFAEKVLSAMRKQFGGHQEPGKK
ncbi:MAG: decarboxylating 6-phosphogluconate dehydrogenase [Rhodoferax sp.]|nr:decarboxylating 6-phosphogluconate dehydrogenase [Rhodoferax sp.]